MSDCCDRFPDLSDLVPALPVPRVRVFAGYKILYPYPYPRETRGTYPRVSSTRDNPYKWYVIIHRSLTLCRFPFPKTH